MLAAEIESQEYVLLGVGGRVDECLSFEYTHRYERAEALMWTSGTLQIKIRKSLSL